MKRWTFGELRELTKPLESELAKLSCGVWQGAAIDVDPKTNEPIIRLIFRSESRVERWLYYCGFKKLPKHPERIGALRVMTEVRGIAYAGRKPPGLLARAWRLVRRMV